MTDVKSSRPTRTVQQIAPRAWRKKNLPIPALDKTLPRLVTLRLQVKNSDSQETAAVAPTPSRMLEHEEREEVGIRASQPREQTSFDPLSDQFPLLAAGDQNDLTEDIRSIRKIAVFSAPPSQPLANPVDKIAGLDASMPNDAMTLYDAALHALAEARRVDQVKDVRDKAVAMAEYAKQAKDRELLEHATAIRLRAERRAGEMLAEMAEKGERDNGKGNRNASLKSQSGTPKLLDLGITKSESSKWQRLALLSQHEFERTVEQRTSKALSSINRTSTPSNKARVNGDPLRDLQKIIKAVQILCRAASPQTIASVEGAGPKRINDAELARAIEFLQELQSALWTRVSTLDQLALELRAPGQTR